MYLLTKLQHDERCYAQLGSFLASFLIVKAAHALHSSLHRTQVIFLHKQLTSITQIDVSIFISISE